MNNHKKDLLQSIIQTSEERVIYYRKNRGGTAEQVRETDNYIHQYEQIKVDAELKLLKIWLSES